MFSEKIYLIRQKFHYSQERFAEKLGVSRQAVQRWENGTAFPDIENMKSIARVFGVSLDWLNDLPDNRNTDEIRHQEGLVPSYERMGQWETYGGDLMTDYFQAQDEGKDVADMSDLIHAVAQYKKIADREKLADVLFHMMYNAPMRSDYRYREPDDLNSIRLLRPKSAESTVLSDIPIPTETDLREKMYGAWLGRICGCLLGKPIECIKSNELNDMLKHTDNYPMHRYITNEEIRDPYFDSFGFNLRFSSAYADLLSDGFPGDDDTNFTIMAAMLIERSGRDFTSEDVCNWWKSAQTMYGYATAEKVAYRNMIAGYFAPDTAVYKNPFREWIGAQIRGDYYGYINPGDPETAAEMAWRDARVSHVKNGIYGEMFVAAMLASAAVLDDPEKIILCGMAQIPSTSRLYENLQYVLDFRHSGRSWDEYIEDFYKRWDEYRPHDAVHTISNAELVTAALLYGDGDYGKTIGLAVQPGFDTDCNGATAGSVIGMVLGRSGIDPKWTAPIGDKCYTYCRKQPLAHEAMVDMIMRHIALKKPKED